MFMTTAHWFTDYHGGGNSVRTGTGRMAMRIDGYIKLARALEPLDMVWLEIDLYDPAGLNLIRRSARTPIASLESIYGRRNFRPYFEQQSVDYAIIDVAWNGILESLKIAAMADAYEVNIAPHNSTVISAR